MQTYKQTFSQIRAHTIETTHTHSAGIHKITLLYNKIYWSPNAMPRSCLVPTKMIYFDRKLNCICSTIYTNSVYAPSPIILVITIRRTEKKSSFGHYFVYLNFPYRISRARAKSVACALSLSFPHRTFTPFFHAHICAHARKQQNIQSHTRNIKYYKKKVRGKVVRAMHKYNKNLQEENRVAQCT